MSTSNTTKSNSTSNSNNNSPNPGASSSSAFLGDHPNLHAANPVSTNTAAHVPPAVTASSSSQPSSSSSSHLHHVTGTGSAPTTLSVASGTAAASSLPRSHSSDQLRNMELNSHTSPAVPSQSYRYPAIPRFSPAIPTRMSGGSSGDHRNSYNGHIYPRSASNSPPGTPPNGLRSIYLNAALQRSQQNMYLPGAGRSSPRPPQLQMPPAMTAVRPPPPTITKRSYSADQLAVEEPEIMVTSPGGTNEVHSTQEHVLKLERALSNLIESQENEDRDTGEEADGPIVMKSKKNKGTSKFPKIVHDRLDPEKVAAITNSANNSASNTPPEMHQSFSDLTLRVENKDKDKDKDKEKELSEKDANNQQTTSQQQQQQQQQQKDSTKKRAGSRMSWMFSRDHVAAAHLASAAIGGTQDTNLTHDASFQPHYLSRQPTKGGVLSNLLKLQAATQRQPKHHGHKEHKEKKKDKSKRPSLYPRSANNSVSNILGTYPPLPNTVGNGLAMTTGVQNNAGGGMTTNRASNRYSLQYDPSSMMPTSFPPAHSPIQSPNGSPRGSFSGDMTPTYMGSLTDTLTAEEKLRITFAVADTLERQDYILRLARAMIRYGAPSHRLEDAIDSSARTLEINLQCVYLPNVMVIAFTDYETHTSETHLLKVSAGLDMYRFAQVHQVLKMVTHSVMSVEEAIMKLDAINTEKDIHPRWLNILAYATASFSTASMFYKGGWVDAGVSVLMGTAVGLMTWLSEKVPSYSNICEVTMSVVVAFIAEGLHSYVCRGAVKMAGIVMLLPGYTITMSILEMSSRHIISGSVRLFYAIIYSLLLGYGLTIGASLWKLVASASNDPVKVDPTLTSACPTSLDPKWNILFVPLFAISLNIWLKAHPRQWPLACVLSIIGYAVSWSTATFGGAKSEVSSALASFAIGFVGNMYQRLTHQLTFQAVVCAVFFLVPGSLGLKGSMALFTEDMVGGANFALEMVTTAIAISVGLFCASLVVYPMGKTRSAQMTF
ncbi:hypothetical protein BGW42_003145 [Actinomortierella wolfii]|nr:hypothetical protein BGW42_003145 [Actinomortierella wolfii]